MSLNDIYKKDTPSADGSVSPGLTHDDQEERSSLVDILIQSSQPQ